MSKCEPCLVGFYCPLPKMFQPIICDEGKICKNSGLIVPDTTCPKRYICLKGVKYLPNDVSIQVFNITKNYYEISESFDSPMKCPKGYSCQEGTGNVKNTTALSPFPCGINTYSANDASSQCTSCPNGYECPEKSNYDPIMCKKGYYKGSKNVRVKKILIIFL